MVFGYDRKYTIFRDSFFQDVACQILLKMAKFCRAHARKHSVVIIRLLQYQMHKRAFQVALDFTKTLCK
jgi:hypothetical protein